MEYDERTKIRRCQWLIKYEQIKTRKEAYDDTERIEHDYDVPFDCGFLDGCSCRQG